MLLTFDEKPSDSPIIEKIWRSRSLQAGEFLSVAQCHFEMAVSRYKGKTFLTLRGPETKVSRGEFPGESEWLGIRFKLGTFMPELTPGCLRDRNDVTLPGASSRSFWLKGSAWEYPTFDNADIFVKRLIRKGLIRHDPAVEAAVHGENSALSLRSIQRRFLLATGVTHSTVRQIERARYATNLLKQGASILDAVHEAGYFDQAHLTRSLKYRIGQTPAEIVRAERQLSFLYKTKAEL